MKVWSNKVSNWTLQIAFSSNYMPSNFNWSWRIYSSTTQIKLIQLQHDPTCFTKEKLLLLCNIPDWNKWKHFVAYSNEKWENLNTSGCFTCLFTLDSSVRSDAHASYYMLQGTNFVPSLNITKHWYCMKQEQFRSCILLFRQSNMTKLPKNESKTKYSSSVILESGLFCLFSYWFVRIPISCACSASLTGVHIKTVHLRHTFKKQDIKKNKKLH